MSYSSFSSCLRTRLPSKNTRWQHRTTGNAPSVDSEYQAELKHFFTTLRLIVATSEQLTPPLLHGSDWEWIPIRNLATQKLFSKTRLVRACVGWSLQSTLGSFFLYFLLRLFCGRRRGRTKGKQVQPEVHIVFWLLLLNTTDRSDCPLLTVYKAKEQGLGDGRMFVVNCNLMVRYICIYI